MNAREFSISIAFPAIDFHGQIVDDVVIDDIIITIETDEHGNLTPGSIAAIIRWIWAHPNPLELVEDSSLSADELADKLDAAVRGILTTTAPITT